MVAPPLTSDEQTALNGPSTRRTYLSVITDDDSLVTTLTVNQVVTFPLVQLTVTGTTTGVKKYMEAVVIRSGAEVGRYRVRKDASGTTLYLMELGRADPGALSYVLRPDGIQNGDTIEIYDRLNVYSVLPRIVLTDPSIPGNLYEDYDDAPGTRNSFPNPIANMRINNARGGHFFKRVADGGTVAISATVTVLHWPTSSSATYAWTVPGAWTGVSGTSSATLTGTAPVGNWKLECLVTPNLGPAFTITRRVHIHDTSTNPPILLMDGTFSSSRDRTGRRMSFGLADEAIASVPHSSMVMVANECTWNGSATSVPTATTLFVGWMNRIGFTVEQQSKQATPEIIGPAGLLDLLGNSSQLMEVKNLATTWQEMTYPLATVSWVIWWLLTYRASNLLRLFNYWPISTAADVGRLPAFNIPGGSLLSQVKGLARRYHEANFGVNSGGEMFVRVHPSMTPLADREDLRDTLTADKYSLPLNWEQSLRPGTRQVQGGAYTWDGVSALPTALRSDAPEKPGQGTADDSWQDQIVDSQDTLNEITGLRMALLNNPIPQGPPITIPHNRDVYEPAEMPRVGINVPANRMPTGEAWDFVAVPLSVTERYLANGATEIVLTPEPETNGAQGVTVPVPPPGSNVNPDLPPVDELPIQPTPDIDWGPELPIDPGSPTPLDPLPGGASEYPDIYGGTSDGHAWKVTNGTFTDISPTSDQRTALGTGIQLVQDPWNYKRAFFIGQSGILYTNDIAATSVVWNIYARYGVPESGESDFDFTVSAHGWAATDFNSCDTTYMAGVGFVATPSGVAGLSNISVASYTISPTHITSATITYVASGYIPASDEVFALAWNDADGHQGIVQAATVAPTASPVTQSVTPNATIATINLRAQVNVGPADVQTGAVTITHATIHWQGSDPFNPPPPFALDDETLIGSFQGYLDKKNAFCWLSKRTISAVDYVYFNRTLDNFASHQQVQVAKWAADMNYSIAVDPFNWRWVWCSAGDPAGSDAFVYLSIDGGGSFTASSVSLYTHGGQLRWNWSTGTPNKPNTTNANVLIVRGLNGSNNYLIRRGLSGSDITIANGSGKYGLQPDSLYQLARDGDFVRVALQDKSVYISDDFIDTFDAAASVSGTQLRGIWLWPTDDAFGLLFGAEVLSYTITTFSTYVNMWSDYDTWRASRWSTEGGTIISAFIDLGQHYITPVAGGG